MKQIATYTKDAAAAQLPWATQESV
jgi:hypothetical protein